MTPTHYRPWPPVVLFCATASLLFAKWSPAQPNQKKEPAVSSQEDTQALAREWGYRGVEAFEAAQFSEALRWLGRAYAILPASSLGLWSARAMVKTNNWLDAKRRYKQVVGMADSPGEAKVQENARLTAREELEALTKRMPAIQIEMKGASWRNVVVTIDGESLFPTPRLGRFSANPGQHNLTAALLTGGANSQPKQLTVRCQPGKVERVQVDFRARKYPLEPSAAPKTPEKP